MILIHQAKKISSRFEKIEKVELENIKPVTLPAEGNSENE